MPKPLLETATITEAAATAAKDTGLLPVQFLSPGWGSSGYYSPQVVEAAATDQVIPAGTHMYADHPTDTEHAERPVRSIKDLMAVTVGDARLATQEDVTAWGADLGALVGEAKVVPAWRDLVETVRDQIGTSIRGSATDLVEGEAEGRTGLLVEGLVAPVMSVDFVTRAGRGGRVLSVMESARANHRAMSHGVSEATVNDTREALQTVLRDAYGAAAVDRSVWIYVRDFDDTTVWFEVEGSGAVDPGIYGQDYTNTDGVVTLTGSRTEVRVRTTYVLVTRPDSTNPTTEADQEITMGNIQVEESIHKDALAKAGRVDALESELAIEKAMTKGLKEAEAARTRTERATAIVVAEAATAGVTFSPREVKGLLADINLTQEGALDEAAFTTLVKEDAAAKLKESGVGRPRGFGADHTPISEGDDEDIDLDKVLAEAGLIPAAHQIKEA